LRFSTTIARRITKLTEEKRRSERKENMIVIEFRKAGTTDDYYAGITQNFSDYGFSFESDNLDCRSGAVLDFKLKHLGRDKAINFLGIVVWTMKQKYGLIAGVKLHTVPTEKQSILAEIISLSHPPADSATRKELSPVQSPSAEGRAPVLKESDSSIITESIVSAIGKSCNEETTGTQEKAISEVIPPEVRTERPDSASKEKGSMEEKDISSVVPPEVRNERSSSVTKVKNKPGKISPVLIMVLIISASAVLAGYFIYNSSTEKINFAPALDQEAEKINIAPALNQEVEKKAPVPALDQEAEKINLASALAQELEKADPDTGLVQGVDLIPYEDIPAASVNRGAETLETVEGERFVVHVCAWETKGYAMAFNKKVMRLYPDAIIVFENDHHIVMVQDIVSREEALSIVEDLAGSLDVSPLIYVQKSSLP